MTAREDFRAAVREAVTYRSSDDLAAAIGRAGDAYMGAALLSLAAELEAESLALRKSGLPSEHIAAAAFWDAAQLARQRAAGGPGAISGPGLAPTCGSGDSKPADLSYGTADDCLEAGPE